MTELDLSPTSASEDAIAKKSERLLAGSTWIFFPEALFAVPVLLFSPILFARLLLHGHPSEAIWLALFVIAGVTIGTFAWRHESKPLLYFAMILVLLGGWSGWSVAAPVAQ